MKFKINNDILTKNLQKISRLLTKNSSFPILENILITVKNGVLSLTVTNLEIELVAHIEISEKNILGKTTISGRKLLDICRNSLKSSTINMQLKKNKMHIVSYNSHYTLTTLPAEDFPNHHNFCQVLEFFIPSNILKNMIEKTQFSMGKQDVRYYLNGMLLEKKDKTLFIVATDGYRLAMSNTILENSNKLPFSIIIPRKGIVELYRLLSTEKQLIRVLVGKNNIRIYTEELIFTAQLIEGEYPDYQNVLLKNKNNPIILSCKLLKQSLLRASILSHEKFCGVDIQINNNELRVLSDNQEEETAEDRFDINYSGKKIEISINVYYVLDILNQIKSENVFLFINENINNSIEIESENNNSTTYVVMLLKR